MNDRQCKNCKRDTIPYYIKKYHGYCLDCFNAGIPEKDDLIQELKDEIENLKATISEIQER